MSVQEILSYAMGIIQSLGLTNFIFAGLTIILAATALSVLIGIFRKN